MTFSKYEVGTGINIQDFTIWEVIQHSEFLVKIRRNTGMPFKLLPLLIIASWRVKCFWYYHLVLNYIDLQLKGIFSSLSSHPSLPPPPLYFPLFFFKAKNREVVSMELYNQKCQLTWDSWSFCLQIQNQEISILVIFLLSIN